MCAHLQMVLLLLLLLFSLVGASSKLPSCVVSCGDHESRKFTLRSNLHLSYDVKRTLVLCFTIALMCNGVTAFARIILSIYILYLLLTQVLTFSVE